MRSRSWPVTLRHGPVTLRPLRSRDESAWAAVRARNAEWLGPWDATRPEESDAPSMSFAAMVRSFNKEAKAGRMLPWAIEYADGDAPGVFAGQLTISGITWGALRCAQAGYWVDQRWAGRGVVPTSVALAGDFLFTNLRLHRLEIAIRPENAKSLRVVEKLGFRYEGVRPAYLHVAGAWRDHAVFALNADEVPHGGLVERLSQGEITPM